jgi:hypothetical protein
MKKAVTLYQHPDLIKSEIDSDKKDYQNLSYDDFVGMGKELLKRIDSYQARIAFYACKICDIRHGGPSGKYYTLTDYARDIGLPQKTLANWTRTYRHVIEKLGIPIEKIDKETWKIAARVDERMSWDVRRINNSNNSPKSKQSYKDKVSIQEVQRLWKEESDDLPSFHSELRRWITNLQAISVNIKKRELSLAHDGDLLELMRLLDDSSDVINDHLTKKKKK